VVAMAELTEFRCSGGGFGVGLDVFKGLGGGECAVAAVADFGSRVCVRGFISLLALRLHGNSRRECLKTLWQV